MSGTQVPQLASGTIIVSAVLRQELPETIAPSVVIPATTGAYETNPTFFAITTGGQLPPDIATLVLDSGDIGDVYHNNDDNGKKGREGGVDYKMFDLL